MSKILILDFIHEDTGLKLLFPTAEYYSFITNPQNVKAYPDIIPSQEIYKIELAIEKTILTIPSIPLPTLMVIAPLYKCCHMWNGKTNPQFIIQLYEYFRIFVNIIKNNKFKNILFFDTHSYQYDPNSIFDFYKLNDLKEKIIFFKRNYANNISYGKNVFSFPYIGLSSGSNTEPCVIELLDNFSKRMRERKYTVPDINRLFYCGKPLILDDNVYETKTDCIEKLQKIKNTVGEYLIYREKMPDLDAYNIELSRSKFCLYLTEECNAPSRRIFEILTAGSILMCESISNGHFLWNFDDDNFFNETYFENESDLFTKLNFLGGKAKYYYLCLQKQNTIVNTYMNKKALRNYIEKCVEKMDNSNEITDGFTLIDNCTMV